MQTKQEIKILASREYRLETKSESLKKGKHDPQQITR